MQASAWGIGGTTPNWDTGKMLTFLLEHVEIKEPWGMQVETQTTQENGCGVGMYQFL